LHNTEIIIKIKNK